MNHYCTPPLTLQSSSVIYNLTLDTDSNQISLDYHLLTLNKLSSLTLMHHVLQYLVTLVTPHWTCSSMPVFLLYWGAPD